MKKLIYLLCVLMLWTASCKNDDPEPELNRITCYDSIFHHFYDTTKLTVYDTVRVPIISDHSWVIYNMNNGTDEVDTVKIKNGLTIKLKSDATRFGYDFVKWSTDKIGSGNTYKAGDNFYVDKDITLYAIWQSHDGLHDYEVYNFLAKQAEGSTVDIKIIDLNPDFGKIKTALDKFWKVKVNLNFDDASEVTSFDDLVNCTNILSITLPPNLKELRIELPNITSLKIPETVESLYLVGFTKLEQLNIPECVTSLIIIDCAFKTISIPNSVTILSIRRCAFKALSIPNSVKQLGGIAECPNLTEITISESVESMSMNFNGCTNLKTVKHSLKECSGVYFTDCKSLTSISLPEFRPENPSIGHNAFYGCSSLTSITIPESVTSIGDYAFYGCTSLTSITIPESVTSIDACAFTDCSSLTSLKLENTTPPTLNDWIGYYGTIYVPSSAVNAYKNADVWKDHADQIVGY